MCRFFGVVVPVSGVFSNPLKFTSMHRIGPYSLHCLDVQYFSLDGGSVFGVVPRVMWEKVIRPDSRNRVALSMRLLLISGNGRNILVDAAMGSAWSEKLRDIYCLTEFRLDEELEKVGIRRGDITDVIFTHLHFDHLAGAFEWSDDHFEPIFPAARFHVQMRNFQSALSPNLKERASYRFEFVDALQKCRNLNLLDGDMELFPGIDLICVGGHTVGQQLVRVRDEGVSLVHGGDLLPSAAHLGLARGLGFDIEPLEVINEKKRILSRLLEDQSILFFAHDPMVEAATLRLDDKGEAVIDRVIIFDAGS